MCTREQWVVPVGYQDLGTVTGFAETAQYLRVEQAVFQHAEFLTWAHPSAADGDGPIDRSAR
jgi:hypothetical protein